MTPKPGSSPQSRRQTRRRCQTRVCWRGRQTPGCLPRQSRQTRGCWRARQTRARSRQTARLRRQTRVRWRQTQACWPRQRRACWPRQTQACWRQSHPPRTPACWLRQTRVRWPRQRRAVEGRERAGRPSLPACKECWPLQAVHAAVTCAWPAASPRTVLAPNGAGDAVKPPKPPGRAPNAAAPPPPKAGADAAPNAGCRLAGERAWRGRGGREAGWLAGRQPPGCAAGRVAAMPRCVARLQPHPPATRQTRSSQRQRPVSEQRARRSGVAEVLGTGGRPACCVQRRPRWYPRCTRACALVASALTAAHLAKRAAAKWRRRCGCAKRRLALPLSKAWGGGVRIRQLGRGQPHGACRSWRGALCARR